jgi:hypothetical protein
MGLEWKRGDNRSIETEYNILDIMLEILAAWRTPHVRFIKGDKVIQEIELTPEDIISIIKTAREAGASGEHVYSLGITKSQTASNPDNILAWDIRCTKSAAGDKPIPFVYVV